MVEWIRIDRTLNTQSIVHNKSKLKLRIKEIATNVPCSKQTFFLDNCVFKRVDTRKKSDTFVHKEILCYEARSTEEDIKPQPLSVCQALGDLGEAPTARVSGKMWTRKDLPRHCIVA